MGAIFFYVFIYFIAYYSTNIVNLLSVRPLIRNRYIAALVPVFLVAISHAYMIANSPPPPDTDMTVESAIGTFVVMPVVIVIIGALYFMWKKKDDAENLHNEKLSNLEDKDSSRDQIVGDEDSDNDNALENKSDKDEMSAEKASTDNNIADGQNTNDSQTAAVKNSGDKKESKDS